MLMADPRQKTAGVSGKRHDIEYWHVIRCGCMHPVDDAAKTEDSLYMCGMDQSIYHGNNAHAQGTVYKPTQYLVDTGKSSCRASAQDA